MRLLGYLKRLLPVDWLLICYLSLTGVFILGFYQKIPFAHYHLFGRAVSAGLLLLLPLLDNFLKARAVLFLRIAYPLAFLGFFYAETDALNNVFFSNLDYHFARFEMLVFGFQPALDFYASFPYKWFSEFMNLGYFSYYFLILGFAIHVFIKNESDLIRIVFLICCSFIFYYLIFIIIPVSGPQYYFKSPYNSIPNSGIFRTFVLLVEKIGERPTAAFPSSHVGIIFILILLAWKKYAKSLAWLIPFFILLSISTVYIKAHYAIDVLGGLLSAPIILWFSNVTWKIFKNHTIQKTFL